MLKDRIPFSASDPGIKLYAAGESLEQLDSLDEFVRVKSQAEAVELPVQKIQYQYKGSLPPHTVGPVLEKKLLPFGFRDISVLPTPMLVQVGSDQERFLEHKQAHKSIIIKQMKK
jgi:hypothetical protein